MKSRRDFLSALGFGATALLLPGTAQAWGGRRRRRRFRGDCEVMQTCVTEAYGDRMTRPLTACACACPQYLYGEGNGIYYYYCICCCPETSPPANTPSSKQYLSLPVECNRKSECIGSTCSDCSETLEPMRDLHKTGPDDEIYLDADAKYGTSFHAAAYISGITPWSPKRLDDRLRATCGKTNVSKAIYVTYRDGGNTRYVALYKFTATYGGKPIVMRIGQEVTTTAAIAPVKWETPPPKFPCYHKVYYGSPAEKYHVAIKKP
jgi:hypothetical protein